MTVHVPRSLAIVLTVTFFAATPAFAQEREGEHGLSPLTDLGNALKIVEDKMTGLAREIPEADYDWRPGEGVRSVREVFLHVAADNYFIPIATGVEAPASTGITGDDYTSARRYEGRDLTKNEVVAELQASFEHLMEALSRVHEEDAGKEVELFGMTRTVQGTWILATNHVHEHLGQMIAYARTNGVTPPWSR